MRIAPAVALVALSTVTLALACGKDETPPPQTPTNQGYPQQQPGYPQQGAPQQGYPQQGAPQQGAPTGAPAPAPAASGAMAVPGPLAFPCTSDATCGTHHCNTQYGKCAFPCASDADCIQNTHCLAGAGICAMKPPGQ